MYNLTNMENYVKWAGLKRPKRTFQDRVFDKIEETGSFLKALELVRQEGEDDSKLELFTGFMGE